MRRNHSRHLAPKRRRQVPLRLVLARRGTSRQNGLCTVAPPGGHVKGYWRFSAVVVLLLTIGALGSTRAAPLAGLLVVNHRPEIAGDPTPRRPGSATGLRQQRGRVSAGTPAGDQEVATVTDGLGQVVSATTNATSDGEQTSGVANHYNFWGGLEWQDQQLGDGDGNVLRVRYEYDQNGRLTRVYWPSPPDQPSGDFLAYSNFDGLDRPRTIRNCVGGCYTEVAKYTFVGNRVATKEYPQPDPAKTVRQTLWSPAENNYDAFGRLTRSHAVRDPDGAPADVMNVQYQYDNGGNPTWRYDAQQNSGATQWSQKYEYDQLNRLSCAMQGAVNNWQGQGGQQLIAPQKHWVWNDTYGGQTYSLDAMGNFVKFYNNGTVDERTHNTSNEIITRLLGGTAKNPSFDAAGNMTDDGEQYKFVYDFRNRLVGVTTRDATPKKVLDFAYDGLDRRIRKITYAGDGTTVTCDLRFLYDGQRIIETRDHANANRLLARYVYGTQYVDEPIRMYRDSNLDDSFADPNDNFYFLQDRLFNVVALTDPDGQVQERVVYEPYGKSTCHRVSDGDETVASHFGNPYLFTGRELDSETGLYNYRGRYYDVPLARFINRDPIGYGGGRNLYGYVGDRPTKAIDPFGLEAVVTDNMLRYLAYQCACTCGTKGQKEAPGANTDAQQLASDEVFEYVKGGVLQDNELTQPGPDGHRHLDERWAPHSAMRHCIASALLAKRTSCECSACIGDQREIFQYLYGDKGWGVGQQSKGVTIRTLYNNAQGRLCAGCVGALGKTHPQDEVDDHIAPPYGRGPHMENAPLTISDTEIVKCCRTKLLAGQLALPGRGFQNQDMAADIGGSLPAQPAPGTVYVEGWGTWIYLLPGKLWSLPPYEPPPGAAK